MKARWILTATILGSAMAFIDGTVINVALPILQSALNADVSQTQWVVDAYLLVLSSLMLAGGSLGDRVGRVRIYALGVAIFAIGSLWCGASPNATQLIIARAVQGLGAALLVPGSLAIITATFPSEQRGRAIGTWSAMTSLAIIAGPILITLSLGIATYVLIERKHELLAIVAVVAFVAFIIVERRARDPIVPMSLFKSRTFTGANALTLLLYGALSAATFLLPFNLIQVQHYSPAEAGAAFLPFVATMSLLSRFTGALADRIGARIPLIVGPTIAGIGFALMARPGIVRMRSSFARSPAME